MRDSWNPQQYEKFKNERSQPFFDLMTLLEKRNAVQIVDLGCGTGELTRLLHESFPEALTLGVDNSPNMIEKAKSFAGGGLSFELADIQKFSSPDFYDVIFSNAALQWCSDHPALFSQLRHSLRGDGQLAVQMPMNHDYPTHVIAGEVASRPAYRGYLPMTESGTKTSTMLKTEDYASLLFDLGFKRQRVSLHVYPHVLESREGVIEWVKGTMLTYYQTRFPPEVFASFMLEFREELFKALPDKRPFFYPFKRLLLWASLAAT
jgi:trans-aconitate 2-methyltransferase